MTIPEIPDGAVLPYYDLTESRLTNREVKDGGADIKTVYYPITGQYLQIGVVRRRTHRTITGGKAPIDEDLAKEDVAARFQMALGVQDVSVMEIVSQEIAVQTWLDCDLIIDGESVRGCRWQQDDWSVVMYLTPTLIIYVILPNDHLTQPVRLSQI